MNAFALTAVICQKSEVIGWQLDYCDAVKHKEMLLGVFRTDYNDAKWHTNLQKIVPKWTGLKFVEIWRQKSKIEKVIAFGFLREKKKDWNEIWKFRRNE